MLTCVSRIKTKIECCLKMPVSPGRHHLHYPTKDIWSIFRFAYSLRSWQNRTIGYWHGQKDSNLYQRFWRAPFYQLNYAHICRSFPAVRLPLFRVFLYCLLSSSGCFGSRLTHGVHSLECSQPLCGTVRIHALHREPVHYSRLLVIGSPMPPFHAAVHCFRMNISAQWKMPGSN